MVVNTDKILKNSQTQRVRNKVVNDVNILPSKLTVDSKECLNLFASCIITWGKIFSSFET